MKQQFKDAEIGDVDEVLQQSCLAFQVYRKKNLRERAGFIRAIAKELALNESMLISSACQETNLQEDRLKVEFRRTIFQLTSYADACAEGTWLDIRIDTADTKRNPPKPDVRKMLVPLGPVVVFGASNFPFAYSTAGGDTACAFAAGCTVVVKAHPAHAATSEMVSGLIKSAARKCNLPDGVFMHVHGSGFDTGKALVEHPLTKAVGFTGSFEGGKALFDIANRRSVPIPVFAEMGSINPVFLLPRKLKQQTEYFSSLFAASITQSAGQFCTKPGVLVGIESEALDEFKFLLGEAIKNVGPEKMLHEGIAKSFIQKRTGALSLTGVKLVAQTKMKSDAGESIPTLAEVTAIIFMKHPHIQHEVFGPFSLIVTCRDIKEMREVAKVLEGQLTCSVIATDEEIFENKMLMEDLTELCGRLVMNGVPTGVEVGISMQHGGPFPATTDSRFTAVGADGIKRFARPICLQNWDNTLLPEELKNENLLHLWRTVNNKLTQQAI